MHIATAMRRMQAVLGTVDPPDRQVKAVHDWASNVADVLATGKPFMVSTAADIDDRPRRTRRGWQRPPAVRFLYGTATHRAWRDLCSVIIAYLQGCEVAAHRAHASAVTDVQVALHNGALPETVERLKQRAARAAKWQLAARRAIHAGQSLIHVEDRIQVPVGHAIRKVGAADVAQDKSYHQRGTARR